MVGGGCLGLQLVTLPLLPVKCSYETKRLEQPLLKRPYPLSYRGEDPFNDMVTAVEPNMVGVLRRLHLHPMDAALNEFTSQGPLAQLKFDPHTFLFQHHKQKDGRSHTGSNLKRPIPQSVHTDPPNKKIPNWRVLTLDDVRRSLLSRKTVNLNAITTSSESGRSGRTRRASVTVHALGVGKTKNHGEGSKTGVSSVRSPSISSDPEDISDAAYLIRHSKLETEEIRRERRSRQHTMEQELKMRWELRDQASWQKRQPQSRVDPLAKYNPKDRMPTHLLPAFTQKSLLTEPTKIQAHSVARLSCALLIWIFEQLTQILGVIRYLPARRALCIIQSRKSMRDNTFE
ncbi:unnamed protein product [Echinostoma caproni]|uniref:PEHE domain-containing protein n=1 Tax=Echinostoma caproni TaxID=27848 RepID=A0A183AI28_9TREM|nr:unnamed protein product [Echinostoma caproni]